ncbi:unnamed protein product [Paramecium pentaurelia]|uniref:AtC3H23-like CCCH zinc finger domain-containing protein n=1 Tax=Paramecium pentaurelia TaxID=43138 RepID=A0A8S1W859_9CILI|nr:unnamed protein product [Paramecium pentaurelia]
MKGQQTPSRFPKINQFETQFSHLSLSNFQEQKHNPSICKGMLSMINPKPPCENKKIKQSSQFEQKAHCLKRCLQEEGTSFDLDLAVFKIRPCQRQCEHNHKQCPYFHSQDDLRRPGTYYKAELCSYKVEQKECPHGYSCSKAHNQYELLYQEDNYRKLFCPQPEKCCFGMYCPYAHFEKDIKCELIHLYQHDQDYFMFHYKTIACPYTLFNHNLVIYNLIRSTCDYYHNENDKRRKVQDVNYQPQQCPNWIQNKSCSNECSFCHSIFELYFHPYMYKTFECNQQNCIRDKCPGYHDEKEFRQLNSLVRNGIMKIVPKNRFEEKQPKTQIKLPSINQ